MEAILEQIVASPKFGIYLHQLQDKFADEQKKREEFYAQVAEDDKAEFINGEAIYHSPVRFSHNEASFALAKLLGVYVSAHGLGAIGHEKLMISLTRNDYEPDICFFSKAKAIEFTPRQLHFPAPDFVVEVLSESTKGHDRGVKFEDYAAHGVTEYWIVDPDQQTVEQYVLQGETYARVLEIHPGRIRSVAIAGFEIPVRAIFDGETNLAALKEILAGSDAH